MPYRFSMLLVLYPVRRMATCSLTPARMRLRTAVRLKSWPDQSRTLHESAQESRTEHDIGFLFAGRRIEVPAIRRPRYGARHQDQPVAEVGERLHRPVDRGHGPDVRRGAIEQE